MKSIGSAIKMYFAVWWPETDSEIDSWQIYYDDPGGKYGPQPHQEGFFAGL